MNENWKRDLTPEEKKLALGRVIDFCHANLFSNTKRELKYLHNRGIYDATIRTFKLGAMPKDINMLIRFVGKRELFKCGIVGFDDGKIVFRFADHTLVIPVYNEFNEPVAIIGRTLLSDKERERKGLIKYINTFYKKGKSLFGLSHTKATIRQKSKAYIVEGNFDVISAYQNGMRNVVASSGTFLTKHQVLLLSRYTDTANVLFDNDEPGLLASEKVKKKYKDFDAVKIKTSRLPSDVKDLDEYFCKKRNSKTV